MLIYFSTGPMSKAIVRAGGKEIIEECEELVRTGKIMSSFHKAFLHNENDI